MDMHQRLKFIEAENKFMEECGDWINNTRNLEMVFDTMDENDIKYAIKCDNKVIKNIGLLFSLYANAMNKEEFEKYKGMVFFYEERINRLFKQLNELNEKYTK